MSTHQHPTHAEPEPPFPEQFGADTPISRPGQPAELAPLYVFLAADDSRYISEVIGATGGKPLH